MKLALIGGGNMGGALLRALVSTGTLSGDEILVVEPDPEKRQLLQSQTGCAVKVKADADLREAGVLLLAVKPQASEGVMKEMKPFLESDQLVISVMAGVSLSTLEKGLGHSRLVRAMPNTPALIGEGMSVFYAAHGVEKGSREWVRELFSACGTCLEVNLEDAVDAATAVSGSGPAYLYFLAEQMIESARDLGFDSKQAELLVRQTLKGAVLLMYQQQVPAEELRRWVTSPGGTTEAALKSFSSAGVDDHLRKGIGEAYRRALELSGA